MHPIRILYVTWMSVLLDCHVRIIVHIGLIVRLHTWQVPVLQNQSWGLSPRLSDNNSLTQIAQSAPMSWSSTNSIGQWPSNRHVAGVIGIPDFTSVQRETVKTHDHIANPISLIFRYITCTLELVSRVSICTIPFRSSILDC